MAHQVIISYSTHDKPQADAICNRLEAKGIRCWIAPRDVPPGSEYADSIVKAIESSKALILVYSANADKSTQVRREVERAVSSDVQVIPVRIDDARMSHTFEYYVGSIHWLDAITPPLEKHIDKLAAQLKVLLANQSESNEAVSSAVDSSPAPAQSHTATVPDIDSPASAGEPSPTVASKPDNEPPSGRGRKFFVGAVVVLVATLIAGVFVTNNLKQKKGAGPTPGKALDQYAKTANAAINGYNNKHITNVSPEDCAIACNEESSFRCLSFDYYKNERKCDLSDHDGARAGTLTRADRYDHYMHEERAAQGRFTKTPNAAISGHNLKQLSNVSPLRCMDECLKETSFRCVSFDYYKNERKCDLSDKRASDVKLSRSDDPNFRWDHYSR